MITVPESAAVAATGDLSVWPASTTEPEAGELTVAGVPLTDVADRFGTPVYVLDEQEVRDRCRTYRLALPDADIRYAAKAFLCRAMARWVTEEGLGMDVCSAGELQVAVAAGLPAGNILLHGNAKSPADLGTALRLGVGRIVIDSASEIARLAAAVDPGSRQKVMVRVVPGVAAGGHDKIRTGTDDQKFGVPGRTGGRGPRRGRDPPPATPARPSAQPSRPRMRLRHPAAPVPPSLSLPLPALPPPLPLPTPSPVPLHPVQLNTAPLVHPDLSEVPETVANVVGLIVAIALLAYLVLALTTPERL